jgi:hypothetical protein
MNRTRPSIVVTHNSIAALIESQASYRVTMGGSDCIWISAILAPYLRDGIRREISAILEDLLLQVDTVLEPNRYRAAFGQLDEAQKLFETIGITDELPLRDIQLDLSRWGQLALRALQRQHAVEVGRLQDYADEGFRLSPGAVPELGHLVDTIRERVCIKACPEPCEHAAN